MQPAKPFYDESNNNPLPLRPDVQTKSPQEQLAEEVKMKRGKLLREIEDFPEIQKLRRFREESQQALCKIRENFSAIDAVGNDFDRSFIEVFGEFQQGHLINWDLMYWVYRWESCIGIVNAFATSRSYTSDENYNESNTNAGVSTLDAARWLAEQGILVDIFILNDDIDTERKQLDQEYEYPTLPWKQHVSGKNPELVKLMREAKQRHGVDIADKNRVLMWDDEKGIIDSAKLGGFQAVQVELQDEEGLYRYEGVQQRAKLNGLSGYLQSLSEYPEQHRDDPEELRKIAKGFSNALELRKKSIVPERNYVFPDVNHYFAWVTQDSERLIKSISQLRSLNPDLTYALLSRTFSGETLLGRAVNSGNSRLVEFLLSCGADSNQLSSFSTVEMAPLIWASDQQNNDVFRVLLNYGANLEVEFKNKPILYLLIEWYDSRPNANVERNTDVCKKIIALANRFKTTPHKHHATGRVDDYIDGLFACPNGCMKSAIELVIEKQSPQLLFAVISPLPDDKRKLFLDRLRKGSVRSNQKPIKLTMSVKQIEFIRMLACLFPRWLSKEQVDEAFTIIQKSNEQQKRISLRQSASLNSPISAVKLQIKTYRDVVVGLKSDINEFINILVGGQLKDNEPAFFELFKRLYVYISSILELNKDSLDFIAAQEVIGFVEFIGKEMQMLAETQSQGSKRASRIQSGLVGASEQVGLLECITKRKEQLGQLLKRERSTSQETGASRLTRPRSERNSGSSLPKLEGTSQSDLLDRDDTMMSNFQKLHEKFTPPNPSNLLSEPVLPESESPAMERMPHSSRTSTLFSAMPSSFDDPSIVESPTPLQHQTRKPTVYSRINRPVQQQATQGESQSSPPPLPVSKSMELIKPTQTMAPTGRSRSVTVRASSQVSVFPQITSTVKKVDSSNKAKDTARPKSMQDQRGLNK